MSSLAILQSLRESIQGQATVKTVYGEPIEAQGKTIIPVARIVFGFGAGTGTGGDKDSTARGEGGGRDGGARATLKRSPVWDRYLPLLAANRRRTAELARRLASVLSWRRMWAMENCREWASFWQTQLRE